MNRIRFCSTLSCAIGLQLVLFWLAPNSYAQESGDVIHVAVFEDEGVGRSANDLIEALLSGGKERYLVQRINGEQIRQGGLDDVDVLVHPGGSGSKQGRALGDEGRKCVTQFVTEGGGFLGVCGGCYLATNDYTWSLNLIDAKCLDRMHWARGTGTVTLRMSPTATSFFKDATEEVEIHYGQGPLLARPEWDDKSVPNYESLAIYDSEIAKKGAPKGVMKGTSAIARARYGAGRVLCFSPHPELTDGLGHWIPRVVDWLAPGNDELAVEEESITDVIRTHVPEDSAGGIAVLVIRDGEVLHRLGYGSAKGRPITTETRLSLASVTKQFAAMCAMMLIEEGRLDPSQGVSHYLPDIDLPLQGREIRIQDLLRHTSGLANFIQQKEADAIAEFKRQHGLANLNNETHAQWLATMPLRRPPGQSYEYTNSGYVLLTRVVEVITGEPFHSFQRRRIFDALDMQQTTDSSRFNGSGNMKLSLLDYERWDRALWNRDPRLLSSEGYDRLFERGQLDNGEPVNYGFGWQLTYRGDRLVSAEHGGVGSGTTAARNLVRRYADDRTTVAIFAQENPTLGRDQRKALVGEIYEAVRRMP